MSMKIIPFADDTTEKKAIYQLVRSALEECLTLGHITIENACNAERTNLLTRYGSMAPHHLIDPMGLPTIVAQRALEELRLPFRLDPPPDPIVVDFSYDTVGGLDPRHGTSPSPMAVDMASRRLYAFVHSIDVARGCPRAAPHVTLRDATFHEFLHLCGDPTDPSMDGVVRHNMAGLDVIKSLIGP